LFRLSLKRRAVRFLERADARREAELRTLLATLKDEPVPVKTYDVCRLEGYEDVYRVRLGDLRVVYRVAWRERLVSVLYIGPRGRAYDKRY
jgi:mRNA interferase RelE/StbE